MKIMVLSEMVLIRLIEDGHITPEKNIAIISIRSPKESRSDNMKFYNNYKDKLPLNTLFLEFNDLDKETEGYTLFTDEQAEQVLDFVDKVKDNVKMLICQCEVGVCRSPATAAAISKLLYDDDEEYFKQYAPNKYVYRKILEKGFEKLNKEKLNV